MNDRPRTLRTRLAAVAIHFSLSLVVFAVALYLILVEWYPGFHFTVDGGWQGVRIMAAVDLVLGPMLTLIVFNPLKARRLIVLDLTCIGLAQAGALAWGFYAIHSQHPVAVSYLDGTFHPVLVAPLRQEKYAVASLEQLSERKPALVYVAAAANDEEQTRKVMQELMGSVGEYEDPFFFRRLEDNWADVNAHAQTAERRGKESRPFREDLPRFLAEHGGEASDYRYFPYFGRYGACTFVFAKTGEPIDAIGCEPI